MLFTIIYAINLIMTKEQQTHKEEFKLNGEELLKKVKQLIHEGNVRRIIIKDKDDKTLAEFPVTIGAIAAVFAPLLAAVGAIAALVSECTLVVERRDDKDKKKAK